jgi:hypothetical protein
VKFADVKLWTMNSDSSVGFHDDASALDDIVAMLVALLWWGRPS